MSKYQWKIPAFAKGVDPDKAIKEIERIATRYGAITAENILEAAKPKQSLLHPLFTWDNDKAAENWRLTQARSLVNNIEIKIITDGQPRHISVYEIVRVDNKQQYKHIEQFTTSDIQQVKMRTIQELNHLRNKLSTFRNFEAVVSKLDETISEAKGV